MTPIEIPAGMKSARRRLFNRSIDNRFEILAQDGVTEIAIYDEIGFFGISAEAFHDRLLAVTTPRIRLLINSPGGDVFDGLTIYNDLVRHAATVEVEVRGIAASAASLIAMAGDRIMMAENAFMMIHNAWGIVIGDENDLRAFAEVLAKIDGALARTYAGRTGQALEELRRMMDDETWLDSDDAVAKGFADATVEAVEARALFDLSVFDNVPAMLKQQTEKGLRAAGFSKHEARIAAADGFHTLARRDAAHPSRRDAEDERLRSELELALEVFRAA
ncbi:MAG TPA: head maturation protease, ClpP-related [Kiloniellales bacterium]